MTDPHQEEQEHTVPTPAPLPAAADRFGRAILDAPTEAHTRPMVARPGRWTRDTGADTRPISPAAPDESAMTMINRVLGEQPTEAPARTAGPIFGVRRHKPRSVREIAQQRAEQRARHERHLEILETVRAYVNTLSAVGLFVVVVAAGALAFGIMFGWFEWAPTRVR